MQHYSPARLRKPLKRTGERGSGEFEEIEWEEALAIATKWLSDIRKTDPKKLAFFTGRDQSQSLTGWWASQYGTPNFAAHGGFCSVNMAAAGLYTIGGSFWEFGEPDWERAKYFLLFGVAEDHDSNPIKAGLAKLKARGAKVVSINPIRTGYSAVADEWVGIRPGTDGLFVLALVHELLRADKIDLDWLVRYANAHWLVVQQPGTEGHGLFARDGAGDPLCFDVATKRLRQGRPARHFAGRGRRAHTGRRTQGRPGLSAHRRTLHGSEIQPRCGRRNLRREGGNDPPHRRRDRRRRLQPDNRGEGGMDGLVGPSSNKLCWPPGRDARHARHFRPFQRVPHLPRAAYPAGFDRRDRLPRRLPLQGAVPEADSARAKAGRQGPCADDAARRRAARLHHGA